MLTLKSICQVNPNQYEIEIDNLLQKKNPKYYNGLKNILLEYEDELIAKKILLEGTYQSYAGLLKQIAKQENPTFSISYDLRSALKQLGDGISTIMPSIESSLISNKYLNLNNSKDFVFNQMISEMVHNGMELDRSIFAKTCLEVYDEKDFELPMVKLKILRVIDPKLNLIVYSYAGGPNQN